MAPNKSDSSGHNEPSQADPHPSVPSFNSHRLPHSPKNLFLCLYFSFWILSAFAWFFFLDLYLVMILKVLQWLFSDISICNTCTFPPEFSQLCHFFFNCTFPFQYSFSEGEHSFYGYFTKPIEVSRSKTRPISLTSITI